MTTKSLKKLLLTCSALMLINPLMDKASALDNRHMDISSKEIDVTTDTTPSIDSAPPALRNEPRESVRSRSKHKRSGMDDSRMNISSEEIDVTTDTMIVPVTTGKPSSDTSLRIDCETVTLKNEIPGALISHSSDKNQVFVYLPEHGATATGILTIQLLGDSLEFNYQPNLNPLIINASSDGTGFKRSDFALSHGSAGFELSKNRGIFFPKTMTYHLDSFVEVSQPVCPLNISIPKQINLIQEKLRPTESAEKVLETPQLQILDAKNVNWDSLKTDRQVIAHMSGITTQEVDEQVKKAQNSKGKLKSLYQVNAESFDMEGKIKYVWGIDGCPAVVVTSSRINARSSGCQILFPNNFEQRQYYQNISIALTSKFSGNENYNLLVPYVLRKLVKMDSKNNLYIALTAEMTSSIAEKGGFTTLKTLDGVDYRFNLTNPYPKEYYHQQNCGSAVYHA